MRRNWTPTILPLIGIVCDSLTIRIYINQWRHGEPLHVSNIVLHSACIVMFIIFAFTVFKPRKIRTEFHERATQQR